MHGLQPWTFSHSKRCPSISFGIPRHIPDPQSLHLKVLDISIGTITTGRLGFVTHEVLYDLCTRYPRIAAAFWRETLFEGAICRERVANVGCREAYNRMTHRVCELLVRLRAVGLAKDYSCDLPIAQGEFADALGITPVHVNRGVQQMRADGLIKLSGERLSIPDWEKLKQVGEFDPTYLHLESIRPLHELHLSTYTRCDRLRRGRHDGT
ncbi:Crp/Fnr family transcriptional regulator [Microvirga pudoricolor]|uniref:Crp/Fnr family transcriptional regulator n=1 Tax=Microvirga pudoricolor TaxID=2778729 RepID=UPI00194DBBAE|nr:helix-turn-helix domain-containing protein [Microvirga pudoricolor]MBM6595061.1 winged helix-turn-helix domain-containing protein [Microvirga pudoricolor]